jgi:branched-chain amino acid transport system ATP-binding protein
MTTSTPCLDLDSVSREFGGLKAVDRVSLTLRAGDRHALIGPNGAGKTTLFNVISGELKATSGKILLFGSDVTSLPPYERAARGIARTFQISRLFPNLTVRENVLLACEALDRRKFSMHVPLLSQADLVDRADGLIAQFGLSDLGRDLARILSYGDQRKLELALSTAGKPKLLLLDEPMAGLPSGERGPILELLMRLEPRITVLLIEHDIDVAFGFADMVTVLCQGKVLAQGHKDEISANRSVQDIYLGVGVED